MPAITLVGRGAQKTSFDGNFTLSSGDWDTAGPLVQAGDILLGFFHLKKSMGGQAATSVPAGWVEISHSTNYLMRVYYKIAVAGESSGSGGDIYAFNGLCTASSGVGVGSSNILALRGVDRTTPIVAGGTQDSTTGSTIWPQGPVTLAKLGRAIFVSCYERNGNSSIMNSGLHSDVSYFGASTGVSAANAYGGRMSYGETQQGFLAAENVAAGETLASYGTAWFGLRAAVNRQSVV